MLERVTVSNGPPGTTESMRIRIRTASASQPPAQPSRVKMGRASCALHLQAMPLLSGEKSKKLPVVFPSFVRAIFGEGLAWACSAT